ncbi:hypothetical protein E2C01_037624 [Portunus trituberculatus]|uniref:Uncharacterized protein n=1 Tax=Portunus trituberculatus TaxID=210409 RepID=A0A5B7FEJ2_PORTR|nr:hypothetical protein [Portunus trituberculatus]
MGMAGTRKYREGVRDQMDVVGIREDQEEEKNVQVKGPLLCSRFLDFLGNRARSCWGTELPEADHSPFHAVSFAPTGDSCPFSPSHQNDIRRLKLAHPFTFPLVAFSSSQMNTGEEREKVTVWMCEGMSGIDTKEHSNLVSEMSPENE